MSSTVTRHRSVATRTVFRVVVCLMLSGAVGSDESANNATSDGAEGRGRLPLMERPGELAAAVWQRRVGSKMAWLSGLFDHHEWAPHLPNVTEPCGGELRTYVAALHAGRLWASKMNDASGHYNPNLMFGNEYWLGSMNACRELMLRQYYDEVPPYRVAYHVARFNLSVDDGHLPQSKWILLGTCLPASCDNAQLLALLRVSAALHVRAGEGAARAGAEEGRVRADVLVQLVRAVPGPYAITHDVKFLILASVLVAVGTLMLAASLYEGWLERQERLAQVARRLDLEMSQQLHNNNVELGGKTNNNTEEMMRQRQNGVKLPLPPDDDPSAPAAAAAAAARPAGTRESRTAESRRQTTGYVSEILLAFSVLSNGRKMLSTERASDGALTCLHGMRFLSVIWVIMVHTYLTLFYISDNKTLRTVTERNFLYQSVGNASFSVDTFFFISGLLVTILFLRTEDKKTLKKPINGEKVKIGFSNPALSASSVTVSHEPIEQVIIKDSESEQRCFSAGDFLRTAKKFFLMIFYRLIRLTPAYAFVIGVNEIALRYSHNNSVFEPAIFDHVTCDLFWWRNLLYINNLFPQREMCMVWSWYMANDTQFYVVGLLLLLVSVRSLKLSVISMAVLMVSSWVTTIAISWSYQYKVRIQDPFEMFDPLYDKPWARLGPYLVGMMVGWLLHRTKCQIRLPVWSVVLGWPAAIAVMGILIFGMVDGYFEVWPTAFYVSIGHTAWGAALAWVTVACCCGYGGLVNSVLSYRGALPLSRLTYCAYLVHPTIMMYTTFLMDGPIHLQNSMVLVTYAGYAVCSFVASLAISLAFEAPIIRLMKIGISGPGSRVD